MKFMHQFQTYPPSDVYELQNQIGELDWVYGVRLVDNEIIIGVSGVITPEVYASIESIFESYRDDQIRWTIQDRNFELDKTESERKDLEIQVKSRVDELLKWTDFLAKIQSVEVCWTIMTRIGRLLGKNSTKKKIKITVDDRDIIDFTTGQILLRKLEREFHLPAEIRDWRISKQSEQIFQRDPVEENPIDD